MSSTWKIKKAKEYPKLKENIEADAVVVGGGLAGVWCAYLLAKEGKKVVLLEKEKIGGGQTEYTTAFITYAIDTPLAELVKMFGEITAEYVWRSGRDAITLIDDTIEELSINCEFERSPLYIFARSPKEYIRLAEEHVLAEKFGFETVLKKQAKLGFKHEGALEIQGQAKYHPMKFIQGLARAAEELGVVIYENTEAEHVIGNAPVKVLTKEGCIVAAQDAIIATYEPLENPRPTHFKKGMYTSYVTEFRAPLGSMKQGLYVDLDNPYHYLRIDEMDSSMRLIAGGEDHRKELKMPEEKGFKALREYIEELFPKIELEAFRKWKGGILEPSDGLPLIGEVLPHQYVATAFSGNGMTYAAISGMMMRDFVLGRDNPYKEIYDPKRSLEAKALLYKARDYTGEFFGGAVKNIFK